ncbi:VQ motif-containing protein 9 [Linum grandiflorum]
MDNHHNQQQPSSSSSGAAPDHSRSDHHQYLKGLNKLSHKISKPTTTTAKSNPPPPTPPLPLPLPLPPPPPQQLPQPSAAQQQQSQPPVYNINKSDFRDVVQKLTGSPAHDRSAAPPPPLHPPKSQSSRLQRIRPPPLAHLINRPPAASPTPLSPLPPFPAVHVAAESPVSAYMRYLHNSMPPPPPPSGVFSPLAPLVSPRWNSNLHPQGGGGIGVAASPTSQQFQLPISPLPFGCLNSPRGAYPLSPTVVPPVPSPKWKRV